MEPVFVGWLSLLPPIIAIGLALITKEVISSLMIGILSGALIYALNTGLNPVVGVAETTFKLMAGRMDVNILLFLALLGALVVVMQMAGGSRAYGRWASSKLKSKRAPCSATSALGALIFIDDYFNCLTGRHRHEAGHRQVRRFPREARVTSSTRRPRPSASSRRFPAGRRPWAPTWR